MKKSILLSTVVVVMGLAASAFAALPVPPECTFGQGQQYYFNAKMSYAQEIRGYWDRLGHNCDLEDQVAAVYSFLDESGPTFRKCKNAGQNAAIDEVLQQISNECAFGGVVAGAMDGFKYGVTYCQTKGGSFPPAYLKTCKEVFFWVVNTFCPQKNGPDAIAYAMTQCGG